MKGIHYKIFGVLFLVVLGCSDSGTESTSDLGSILEEAGQAVGENVGAEGAGAEGEETESPDLLVRGDKDVTECEPLCTENTCEVDDGCGGSCSCLDEAQVCVDGACCLPSCEGKVCGLDGCGGSCGTCENNDSCYEGACCTPQCDGKECGNNGCGGTCGVCSDTSKPSCKEGICSPTCVPNCINKECGYDGCSGSCGLCVDPGNPVCTDGVCGPDESCGPDGCLLVGKVLSPEGGIPIAGAEVFLMLVEPPPLNENLHCDKCFQFSEGTPLTTTDFKGEFSLPVPSAGEYFMGVQKGGFRRVRSMAVTGGFQMVPQEATTLPGESNAAVGDSVPKMAVVGGGYDEIESTLEGLGIGFDLIDGDAAGVALMTDWEALSQYQVLFLPCAGGWFDSYLSDPDALETVRSFVAAGGRLYVTDWSYDILANVFPEPISYTDHNGGLGSAQGSVYDAPAYVPDAGMWDWLNAQNIFNFELEANWTEIEQVNTYEGPNELNIASTFTPTVWVMAVHNGEAGTPTEEDPHPLPIGDDYRPATVSFQWGCGRALFSTYHTETGGGGGLFGGGGDNTELLPQEKALLYTVLEVVLCIGPKF